MAQSDPLSILLAHNHWATRQILESCAQLTPEQFQQEFEMGVGSLRKTTTHILGAMRGWTDLLAKREFRTRLEEEPDKTPEELLDLLEEAAAEMAEHGLAHPLEETVTRERGGREYTFTRGGVLTHVTTHGMHHRAQCLNMLRQLGVDPLPPTAVVEWMLMVDPIG